ncbi:hypothetical protein SESBI_10690 [Sesbania bispinosa]|nr:hypothetical protein SESBI_10690 [Sesbania bispinosa]
MQENEGENGVEQVNSVQVNNEIVQPNTEEEGAESDNSEDLVTDIHFEDNEKERALGGDEGFSHDKVGGNKKKTKVEGVVLVKREGEGLYKKKGETSEMHRDEGNENIGDIVGGFAPPAVANMNTMEDKY